MNGIQEGNRDVSTINNEIDFDCTAAQGRAFASPLYKIGGGRTVG